MNYTMEEGYVWYEHGCSLCQCPECMHVQHASLQPKEMMVWIATCESCGITFELTMRGY